MAKANWFYNSRDKKWELRDRYGKNVFQVADGGAVAFAGAITGVTNLTVGTLATLRAIDTGGVASLADVRVARAIIGGGATLSLLTKLTGTIPLVNIGTGAAVIATLTGMGSGGIAVGDLISLTPKAAIAVNMGIIGWRIPTTNVINITVANVNDADVGSLPPTGIDVLQMRVAG